jgi:uncharacterized delta-60 repeat protein
MFGTVAVAVALFSAAVAAAPTAAQPVASGGFGRDGRVATIGGLAWPSGREYTAVAGDGDIYVAAQARRSAASGSVQVRRYLPDGELDPRFGGDGRVVAGSAGAHFLLSELLVDTNGLPYLVGTTGPRTLTVVRLTASGAPDPTYGDGGAAHLEVRATAPRPRAVIDQVNRVVLAAGLIARLTPSGALDTSFGRGGTVPIPSRSVDGLGVDAEGRVQLALPDRAEDADGFRLMRLEEDGRPSASLGPTGVRAFRDIGGAAALAVRSDGSTLVLGTARKRGRTGDERVPLLSIGSRGIHATGGSAFHRLAIHVHGRFDPTALLSDPNGDDYVIGTRLGRRRQGLVVDPGAASDIKAGPFEPPNGSFDFFGKNQRIVIASSGELIATGASITGSGGTILVDGIARPHRGGAAHGFLAEYKAAKREVAYTPEPPGGG